MNRFQTIEVTHLVVQSHLDLPSKLDCPYLPDTLSPQLRTGYQIKEQRTDNLRLDLKTVYKTREIFIFLLYYSKPHLVSQ